MDQEKLNSKLNEVQEQQSENQQRLKKHDQLEQEVHALKIRSQRLFSELMDVWQKDDTLASEMDHHRNKLLHQERQVNEKLDDKKAAYLKEKRQLVDLEEALYNEQQIVMRKGDKI